MYAGIANRFNYTLHPWRCVLYIAVKVYKDNRKGGCNISVEIFGSTEIFGSPAYMEIVFN